MLSGKMFSISVSITAINKLADYLEWICIVNGDGRKDEKNNNDTTV
jgi:hypothetical protein